MKTILFTRNIFRLLVAGAVLLAALGSTFAVNAQSSCGATQNTRPPAETCTQGMPFTSAREILRFLAFSTSRK